MRRQHRVTSAPPPQQADALKLPPDHSVTIYGEHVSCWHSSTLTAYKSHPELLSVAIPSCALPLRSSTTSRHSSISLLVSTTIPSSTLPKQQPAALHILAYTKLPKNSRATSMAAHGRPPSTPHLDQELPKTNTLILLSLPMPSDPEMEDQNPTPASPCRWAWWCHLTNRVVL